MGPPGGFGGAGRQRGDRGGPAGQVGGHEGRRTAGADDAVHHLGAAGCVPAVHDHLRARGAQGLRHPPADAAGGAGHQGGPALKLSTHVRSPRKWTV